MRQDIIYALALGAIIAGVLYEARLLLESFRIMPFAIVAAVIMVSSAALVHHARHEATVTVRFFVISYAAFFVIFLPLTL